MKRGYEAGVRIGLVLAGSIVLGVGCASNPNKAREIDSEIQTKGGYMGQAVGIDGDKQMVVQKETTADTELRDLGWRQYDLEHKIQADHELLTRCREELADPRLGGSGKVTEIPEIDAMKPPTQVKEELGITKGGSLSFVRKEMVLERIQAERQYLEALRNQHKTIERERMNCEREMKIVRVKHGLSADRYAAKGYYENGRYVQTRRPEHNLDDAFSIASEEAAAKKKSAADQSGDRAAAGE